MTKTIADVVFDVHRGLRFQTGTPEEELLFASFCIQNMHLTYSQRLQDLWVLYELDEKRNGTFLDFGAGDGRNSSNSYILHRRYGWKGLLIEPNEDYDDNLKHHVSDGVKYATGICVMAEDVPEVDFMISSDPSISTLHYYVDSDEHGIKRRNLPSVTRKLKGYSLASVIENEPMFNVEEIDYLSIDTEGSEFDILEAYFDSKNFPFFTTITVEHNYNSVARLKIFDLLSQNGYTQRFPKYSGHDDWYTRKIKK